jgi:hypothetical protein
MAVEAAVAQRRPRLSYRIVCRRGRQERFELTADSMLELELRRLTIGQHLERLGWTLGAAERVLGDVRRVRGAVPR